MLMLAALVTTYSSIITFTYMTLAEWHTLGNKMVINSHYLIVNINLINILFNLRVSTLNTWSIPVKSVWLLQLNWINLKWQVSQRPHRFIWYLLNNSFNWLVKNKSSKWWHTKERDVNLCFSDFLLRSS